MISQKFQPKADSPRTEKVPPTSKLRRKGASQKFFLIFVLLMFLFIPVANAQIISGKARCGTATIKFKDNDLNRTNNCPKDIPFTSYSREDHGKCVIESVNEDSCTLCNALHIFINIAHFILASVGGIAAIMFLWGGIGLIFNWGSAEQVQKNKSVIVNTLIGMAIILLAWTLVNVLIGVLTTPVGKKPDAKVFSKPFYQPRC